MKCGKNSEKIILTGVFQSLTYSSDLRLKFLIISNVGWLFEPLNVDSALGKAGMLIGVPEIHVRSFHIF